MSEALDRLATLARRCIAAEDAWQKRKRQGDFWGSAELLDHEIAHRELSGELLRHGQSSNTIVVIDGVAVAAYLGDVFPVLIMEGGD